MTSVKHQKIAPSKGRRFAISDIHGCFETLKMVIQQIDLTKEDQLFLLGDLINRGPKSHKVLDFVIDLRKQAYEVHLLRGNHEQLILNARQKNSIRLKKVLIAAKSQKLINEDGDDIKGKYLKLLEDTYHYFDLGDYYLVHAGFDFAKKKPFENTYAMMYIKDFKAKKKFLDGRKIVVGHSPQPLNEIERRLRKGKRKLYIDNGCLNTKVKGQGNMVCLNLDNLTLNIQPNIEA